MEYIADCGTLCESDLHIVDICACCNWLTLLVRSESSVVTKCSWQLPYLVGVIRKFAWARIVIRPIGPGPMV